MIVRDLAHSGLVTFPLLKKKLESRDGTGDRGGQSCHGKNRGCWRRLNKESEVKMIVGFIELPNNA